jgi:hypothetical protein
MDELADGWEVWSDEKTKVVLAYRPDVFNASDFPAPCMPTIYLTKGQRDRRPGRNRPAPDDPWYVTLYLEPDVDYGRESFDSEAGARERVAELSGALAAGDIDYRSLYQVPRPSYFEALDGLTGRGPDPENGRET